MIWTGHKQEWYQTPSCPWQCSGNVQQEVALDSSEGHHAGMQHMQECNLISAVSIIGKDF